MDTPGIFLGATQDGLQSVLLPRMANRHGLIAGATGTGKTVTLQVLAEGFSQSGVPVFMADVKGDLSGLAAAAAASEMLRSRAQTVGMADYQSRRYPVVFWDLYGRRGHPIRATVTDMGPLLLGNLLELNETQSGVLYACFKIADDEGLLLLDLKDLRALLVWVAENAKALQKAYGNLASASIAAIQRGLLVLEQQGAEHFFGEPALDLADLMRTDFSGQGVVSILDATALMANPRLYATFLLWLLAELFEQLPEVGDPEQPKLVFFFDEAHLLFGDAPKALVDKIEQVVRLIRSKGVGVYFISQSPLDIPEDVLGQLGNRVQHALRAFTPKDQRAVKAAAQTFRPNPKLNTEQVIMELGVGEALVSLLDAKGSPTVVERVLIRPPQSRIGPATDGERAEQMARSPLASRYDATVDRESAYELLRQRGEQAAVAQESTSTPERVQRGRRPDTMVEAMAKSAMRSIGSSLGRQIVRGVLGSLFGGRRR
jgi:DNA helicase HerA-like ATPase